MINKKISYGLFFLLGSVICFAVIRHTKKSVKQVAQTKQAVQETQTIKEQVFSFPDNPYQDIIVNNRVVAKGHGPHCEQRYDAIKKLLCYFKRPFTVLDIGAAYGYFSFKIAHDFDATCLMVSDSNLERMSLAKLCHLNTSLDTVLCMAKRINARELELLSACEHFDVVLALNVIHHFPQDQWKQAAEAILNLGDYVIIETPPKGDRTYGSAFLGDIITLIESKNYTVLTKVKRHTSKDKFATMYLVKAENKKLQSRGILEFGSGGYNIQSDIQKRSLVDMHTGNTVAWPRGISLTTFKLLNGVYPTKPMIKESLAKLKKDSYSILPQDIFVQGKKIVSISSTEDATSYDDEMMQYLCGMLDTSSVKQVVELCKVMYRKTMQNKVT